MAAEFVEVERSTWNAILYPDGTMKRVNDITRVITVKDKTRLQGYKKDRILGPAANSSRVKELQQMIAPGVAKEDLAHG